MHEQFKSKTFANHKIFKDSHYQGQSDCSDSPIGVLPATLGGVLSDCISMKNGYLKLWRKIEDSAIFQDSYAFHLFVYLLIQAQREDDYYKTQFKNNEISLKAGQCVIGRYKAARDLNMKESNVRNALKRLSTKYKAIETISDSKRTIVTICKWDTYQNPISKEDNKRTTKGQQKDTKQEIENIRIKNIYIGQVREVIDYLNTKTGSKYRSDSANAKFVSARLADGYSLEDLKTVIDKKCADWLHKDDMKKYLRPETLFNATKFESYINEPKEDPLAKYRT